MTTEPQRPIRPKLPNGEGNAVAYRHQYNQANRERQLAYKKLAREVKALTGSTPPFLDTEHGWTRGRAPNGTADKKEYGRQYYIANKARIDEYCKAYSQKNKMKTECALCNRSYVYIDLHNQTKKHKKKVSEQQTTAT
jgi:hypothetical protein